MLHTGFGMGVDIHSDGTAKQGDYYLQKIAELQKQIADQRERDRFKAARDLAAGMVINGSYNKWADLAQDACNAADALLAELDRTKEAQDEL